MNSILNAETSAGKVLPGTEKEQSINRNSVKQGNTSKEESLNKPLMEWDQIRMVQDAMNRKHNRSFNEWGANVFGTALSPHTEEGYNLVTYSRFFRDLLLFVSKPKISEKFDESVPYGLQMIETLSDLFLELQEISGYEEYALYFGLSTMGYSNKGEFLSHAKKYLSGEDLRRVLTAHGQKIKNTEPAKAPARAKKTTLKKKA